MQHYVLYCFANNVSVNTGVKLATYFWDIKTSVETASCEWNFILYSVFANANLHIKKSGKRTKSYDDLFWKDQYNINFPFWHVCVDWEILCLWWLAFHFTQRRTWDKILVTVAAFTKSEIAVYLPFDITGLDKKAFFSFCFVFNVVCIT